MNKVEMAIGWFFGSWYVLGLAMSWWQNRKPIEPSEDFDEWE